MKPRADCRFEVVNDGGYKVCTVQIIHWWPGRTYNGLTRFTDEELSLATRRGTRWMTVALAVCNGDTLGRQIAKCHPLDAPSGAIGAAIAAGRLGKQLNSDYGVRVVPAHAHGEFNGN